MASDFRLALYDFGSKQNYIYQTNKIKEISGASALLAGMYKKFSDILNDKGISFVYDLNQPFSMKAFENGDYDATALYDGGGNLMALFRSKEKYVAANKIISMYLLKNAPGLQLIASCVAYTDDFTFDREAIYRQNALRKNQNPTIATTAVLPLTQIDPLTFMPVTEKNIRFGVEQSLSADRVAKLNAYGKNEVNNIDGLDEGMLAVIYVDGNSMGEHLKKAVPEEERKSYDDGIAQLRKFSDDVNHCFVVKTTEAIAEYIKSQNGKNGFRQVIGGGDEITIICNADIALDVVKVYFTALETANAERLEKDTEAPEYHACAGISIFHAKSPFSIAYEIAEAACESAKKKAKIESRENPGNYFDFYYCHAGIVTDFDTLRKREEKVTNRPYKIEQAFELFSDYKPLLHMTGRANIKALGAAARKSMVDYKVEAQRINAYMRKYKSASEEKRLFALGSDDAIQNEMKTIVDMSEYYDLWFSKRNEEE